MARWVDLAEWRGPTPNQSGAMLEQRGVVLHIAQGGFEGTIAWQKNPDANVSSHFVCGKSPGETAQMVDTDVTAWTQRAGNGHWLSIENAGFVPDALTEHQVEFAAQILARAHQVYGVPLQVANNPTEKGLGHHSMDREGIDPEWGHDQCPGVNIINQKPAIVARAQQIVTGVDDVNLTDVVYEGRTVGTILRALDVRSNWTTNVWPGLVNTTLQEILAAAKDDGDTTVVLSPEQQAKLEAAIAALPDAVADEQAARLAE